MLVQNRTKEDNEHLFIKKPKVNEALDNKLINEWLKTNKPERVKDYGSWNYTGVQSDRIKEWSV